MSECPRCGSKWIANFKITMVKKRKHWWCLVAEYIPYHDVYPEVEPYQCCVCKYTWGEW